MALTDTQIKALKPRASRYLVSDGRGLSLDILPSAVTTWTYRYRRNGKQLKVTLGRYPDLSLKAARAKRDDLAAQVAQGSETISRTHAPNPCSGFAFTCFPPVCA